MLVLSPEFAHLAGYDCTAFFKQPVNPKVPDWIALLGVATFSITTALSIAPLSIQSMQPPALQNFQFLFAAGEDDPMLT